jgi:hypothetical protein
MRVRDAAEAFVTHVRCFGDLAQGVMIAGFSDDGLEFLRGQ